MTQVVAKKDFFNSPAVLDRFNQVLNGKGQQFTTSLLTVVGNGRAWNNVDNGSIMTAAMKAAVLDLPIEPSLGFAYIVPYKGQAQFQIGYKGLIQLAIRSGQVKKINSGVIYQSQFKAYDPLFETLEADFSQKPDEVAGYFATLELTNGFRKLTYWTKEQVEAHGRRFSMTFGNGPWKTDFDAMARKTLLKQIISKYAPLSVELQTAVVADNEAEQVARSAVDVTPSEADSLTDLLTAPEAEVVASVDPETGEVLEAGDGKLFDNLADLT